MVRVSLNQGLASVAKMVDLPTPWVDEGEDVVEFAAGVEGASDGCDEGFAGDSVDVWGVVCAEGVDEEGVEAWCAVPWWERVEEVADGMECACGGCCGESVGHFVGAVEAVVGVGDVGAELCCVVVCPAGFELSPWELLWVLDFDAFGVFVVADVVEVGVVGEDEDPVVEGVGEGAVFLVSSWASQSWVTGSSSLVSCAGALSLLLLVRWVP